MAKKSAQKFIGRNRAPRVQIEYDLELYGAEKMISLPFVMGVMADLSGQQETGDDVDDKHKTARGSIPDRKFLEIDVDNFDDRMKAMKPKVTMRVPNTLTNEGELSVDITFESMDDFSPAAVARNVDALKEMLDARTQFSEFLTKMDGKAKAEKLMADLMNKKGLLEALAGAPTADAGGGGDADTGGESEPEESQSDG